MIFEVNTANCKPFRNLSSACENIHFETFSRSYIQIQMRFFLSFKLMYIKAHNRHANVDCQHTVWMMWGVCPFQQSSFLSTIFSQLLTCKKTVENHFSMPNSGWRFKCQRNWIWIKENFAPEGVRTTPENCRSWDFQWVKSLIKFVTNQYR